MTGLFDGHGVRDQGNSIVLGENCSWGRTITVNILSNKITFGSSSNTAEISNIQQVIGRKEETDLIQTVCYTKMVAGGGGRNKYSPDVITIIRCWNDLDLTVSVEGYTILEAKEFYMGRVSTLLSGWLGFEARLPRQFEGTLLFKFETSVGRLTSAQVDSSAAEITLGFSDGGSSKFKFIGNRPPQMSPNTCEAPKATGSQISIFLSENSHFSRQLSYNLDQGRAQSVHLLEREGGGGSIYGYDFMDNLFQLKSGSWYVYGGGSNNHFSLISSEFLGLIDGRSGQNTLTFGDKLSESLEINLNSGELHGRNTVQVWNVQTVVGRDDFVERVTTACNTKSLNLGGSALDTVEIPALTCSIAIDLSIAVKGKASIRDGSQSGSVTIQGGYDSMSGCSKAPQPLQLSLNAGMRTVLLLNFPMHKLHYASTASLNIDGGHQVILSGSFPNAYFEEDSELKSTLIEEDGKIVAFHELKINIAAGVALKLRKGSNAIPNVFKLVEGSNWRVSGGNLDDTFSLVGNSFHGEIDGGRGKNGLFIGDEIGGEVRLMDGVISIQGSNSISYQNIAEFHGRSGKPDRITVDCDSQFVGMNGGRDAQNYDIVTIPKMECGPDHAPKLTIVGPGFTQVSSDADRGNFDIYIQPDPSNNMKFKSQTFVTNETVFNFPIQYHVSKLSSYQLEIDNEGEISTDVRLLLKMSENDNFVEFHHKFHNEAQLQNANMMFVDQEFNLIGNILINRDTNELNILHVLKQTGSGSDSSSTINIRRGATGAKNIFRLHSGHWEGFGGILDDTFILNEDNFKGKIHGLGGVNALILTESIGNSQVIVNFLEKTLAMSNMTSPKTLISVNGIQTVVGRKAKQDQVICACDTKLVMLEGGESSNTQDVIQIQDSFCHPSMSLVLGKFTRIENNATGGNFTYHVRTDKNFDINYVPLNNTRHNFNFEIPFNQVKNVKLEAANLEISFGNESKSFPLNFHNMPTFQIVEGPELISELILEENELPHSSIIARAPFSGSIFGLNGASNGITVQTSASIESIMGGDKDDNIFLSQVKSVLLINGRGGTNRLQFSEELHRDHWLEVDFPKERVTFPEDHSSFVTVLKGITLFSGREDSFERVVLGCDTTSVKFADEVIIRSNCCYNVRIEVGGGTRVIFEIGEKEDDQNEIFTGLEEPEVDDDLDLEDELEDEEFEKELEQLEPSTFYYHFSTIKSFDIEVDSFSRLSQTRHIFYLNFTLSSLSSLRFSQDDSRLVYSTFDQNELEYSHLVEELGPSAMFYSQPEFMTGEGFLLRVSRYGEITAVVANPQESLELEFIQQDMIPRLSAYASQLGISFMLETGSEFVDCGSPGEVGLLNNRENVTSHLVGFNGTTYEILDLDNEVFIYPQLVGNDSVHVLDLTDIISQIRNITQVKYVPEVVQVEQNLEIQMTNWTELFPGKVVLTNGTLYNRNLVIMLNSIAMEILPAGEEDEEILPVTDSASEDDENEHRFKRSVEEVEEAVEVNWVIKPRPISIPEGHVYLFAAEDLEDQVEIRKETDGGEDNSTFEYSKDDNDLIITSMNTEEIESGRSTSFILFDYYSPSNIPEVMESDDDIDQNETLSAFGKVDSVNGIHIKLGKEVVTITSNEPLVSEETGEEVVVEFYEDILDREEDKIVEDIPDMPRKFKVSWIKKIGRTTEYRHTAWGVLLGVTGFMGVMIWTFCRKKPATGKYSVEKLQHNRGQNENEQLVHEVDEENSGDYEEPTLISRNSLVDDM